VKFTPANHDSPPCSRRGHDRRPGAWLNPRRELFCVRMLQYLQWHGCKIVLDGARYADIKSAEGMGAYATDLAVDDLHVMGLVDVRLAGGFEVVELLDRPGILTSPRDRTPTAPPPPPEDDQPPAEPPPGRKGRRPWFTLDRNRAARDA
jgi:hypothetical protein